MKKRNMYGEFLNTLSILGEIIAVKQSQNFLLNYIQPQTGSINGRD